MADNGWNRLDWLTIARNCWKRLEMEIAGKDWKWLVMTENAWNWLEMAGNGWK